MGTYANGDELLDSMKGLYGGVDGTDVTLLSEGRVKMFSVSAVAATAANALAETLLCSPGVGTPPGGTAVSSPTFRVLGFRVTAGNSITANDTSYATFTLSSRTSAGASKTTVGTLSTTTTGSGSFAQYQSVAGNITAANAVIPAGGVLTYEITKSDGTGVSVPAGTIMTVFLTMA